MIEVHISKREEQFTSLRYFNGTHTVFITLGIRYSELEMVDELVFQTENTLVG